jgi:hypothetical protein
MTADWSDRTVVHMELDISDSGMQYGAGDAVGVLPQNDPELVAGLLARLGASADQVFEVQAASGGWSSGCSGVLTCVPVCVVDSGWSVVHLMLCEGGQPCCCAPCACVFCCMHPARRKLAGSVRSFCQPDMSEVLEHIMCVDADGQAGGAPIASLFRGGKRQFIPAQCLLTFVSCNCRHGSWLGLVVAFESALAACGMLKWLESLLATW